MRKFFTKPRLSRNFTLIELMAAMTVLLALMYVLFSMFRQADRLWERSGANTEIYENARIIMDTVTRDLQGAVARENDTPGNNIFFEQYSDHNLRFVSAAPPLEGASSPYYEIGYQLNGREFQRASVDDRAAGWNIYRTRADTTVVFASGVGASGFEQIIDGVLSMSFTCYDSANAAQANWGVADTTLAATLPHIVNVSFKLLDSKSVKLWDLQVSSDARTRIESEKARTFSKRIFLGNRK